MLGVEWCRSYGLGLRLGLGARVRVRVRGQWSRVVESGYVVSGQCQKLGVSV